MPFNQKYIKIESLYESAKSSVLRCDCLRRGKTVILKIIKASEPNQLQISRFKREYEIAKSLENEGIVKVLSFEEYRGTHAIVMKDIGADSLLRISKSRKLSIKEKIKIATDYCHSKDKKIYITVNIFAHNHHIKALPKYIEKLKEFYREGQPCFLGNTIFSKRKYTCRCYSR